MDDVSERLTSLEPGTLFAGYRIEGILDRGEWASSTRPPTWSSIAPWR